jgi:hypothetical protein
MTQPSRRILVPIIATLVLFGLTASISAQIPERPINPTMPSQHRDDLKESLYAQFTEYKNSLNPEERRLAYPAGKDYLRKFGADTDSFARDVQRFDTEYERSANDVEVYKAYSARNYAKAFELGR